MIDWPAKDPAAVADYAIDFASRLVDGETITGRTVTAVAVTKDSDQLAGSVVTAWLSGGAEGDLAKVTVTVTTSGGRTFAELALLPIGGGPVSLARAKGHLHVDWDDVDNDARIAALLRGAVAAVEGYTGRALSPRALVQRFGGFADRQGCERLTLYHDPVIEIVSVDYVDEAGAAQTLAEADYRSVEGEPWSLIPPIDDSFPATEAKRSDAVTVRYMAGYLAGECPADLQIAVLEVLRAVHDGNVEIDPRSGLPAHVVGICWSYKRIVI